jgi:NADH:ubiquinone oxidoreductase subunit 3 (subunit A)
MENLMFAPPVVFLMFVVIFLICTKGVSRYSYKNAQRDHGLDAYACGQQNVQGYVNPDYSQFFPFAFFYTIMHVLVLMVATAPYDAPLLPIVYIASGILAMVIIFKR